MALDLSRDRKGAEPSCGPSRTVNALARGSAMAISYGFMSIDPSAQISPTARVHPDARIGAGVRIADYCVIDRDVVIGAGCSLEPYVYIKRWTEMGERNEISAGTALGTDPFDKHFTGARSYLRIGNGNIIREHFTISRGTAPESVTELGDGNYIMSSGHIAHNCKIGERQRNRKLRFAGRLCGGGGCGVHLRERRHSPVLQGRAAGHDSWKHGRE